jgi:hypothetical protein
MAGRLYPYATQIVDIWHAREHLHDLAAHLAFITPDPDQWLAARSEELDAGNIQAIVVQRPNRQAALDQRRCRRHHHPALPARRRPLGRTMASTPNPPSRPAHGRLTDPETQTPGSPHQQDQLQQS